MFYTLLIVKEQPAINLKLVERSWRCQITVKSGTDFILILLFTTTQLQLSSLLLQIARLGHYNSNCYIIEINSPQTAKGFTWKYQPNQEPAKKLQKRTSTI